MSKAASLSHNTVFSILQDRQGFIWIGTGNGLNRFDGSDTKVYKPVNDGVPGQIKGRVIKSRLLEDDDERIWFSTDVAVQCFEKKRDRFRSFNLKTGFANPLVIRGNSLFLSSIDGGVFELNTVTGRSIQYPVTEKDAGGKPINLMYHGAAEKNNNIWFA
ncbi:MAG TPA: two-component regulator propeller domain-containing protein, partial [Chitinophagaceae bacterium]